MKTTEIHDIQLDQIVPDPEQPRRTFDQDALLQLAETMKAGQLQPIVVRGEAPPYTIVVGERRWRAAKLAGLATIRAIIESEEIGDAERLERQLVENAAREDLPALELAEAVERLCKAKKLSGAEVAVRIGKSEATVSRLFALLALPEQIKEEVRAGRIPMSAAVELSRLPVSPEQEELATEAASGMLSRDALARKIKRVLGTSKGKRDSASHVNVTLGDGRSVVVSGKTLTIEILIEMLEQLLGKARTAKAGNLSLDTFVRTLRDRAAKA